jgi:S-adenosylmethionine:tRNA ribosyltransferase-isomerase
MLTGGDTHRCTDSPVLRTSDLDYNLPEAAIAVTPAEPRDSACLMVVSRSDPSRLEHRAIRDLPDLLAPGDLLVFNTTRVLRARLQGRRADTGGMVEGLYLHDAAEDQRWHASPRRAPASETRATMAPDD